MGLLELHKPVEKTFPSIFNSSFNESGQTMVTQRYCELCHVRYPCPTVLEELS